MDSSCHSGPLAGLYTLARFAMPRTAAEERCCIIDVVVSHAIDTRADGIAPRQPRIVPVSPSWRFQIMT